MNTLAHWFGVWLLVISHYALALPEGGVNVNVAAAEELAEALQGVGIARAEAIVEYRDKYGSFETLDDLLAVTGIGQHVIETNKDNIYFSD